MKMKRQIRNNVFETNSSSVHTLVISSKNRGRCHLHVENDGYIHVKLTTYYGKDEKDYTTQLEKLTYIVTWMYVYYGCNLKNLFDGWIWKEFIKKFCGYVNEDVHRTPTGLNEPKCVGIKIDKITNEINSAYDFLDHQSVPWGAYDSENCIINLSDTSKIITFIFDKNLWLHTDCD